jgi:hypothetical protein
MQPLQRIQTEAVVKKRGKTNEHTLAKYTVKASNFGPHGNFGPFLPRSVASSGEFCAKNEKVVYTGYVLYTGLPHQFGASLEDARSLNRSSVLHVSNCHVLLFLDPIFS